MLWQRFIERLYFNKSKLLSKKNDSLCSNKEIVEKAVKDKILIPSGKDKWKINKKAVEKEYNKIKNSTGCPSGDAFNAKYGNYESYTRQKKPSLLQRLFSRKK